jgi:hypothetical protein
MKYLLEEGWQYLPDVLNKIQTARIEGPFEAHALRNLRDTVGLGVISRERKQARNHRDDAVLRFAGTRANITVDLKRERCDCMATRP